MLDIGLDAHQATGEPNEPICRHGWPVIDCERCSAEWYGGHSWREVQYAGTNWPVGECLPRDGDGRYTPAREDVGRD